MTLYKLSETEQIDLERIEYLDIQNESVLFRISGVEYRVEGVNVQNFLKSFALCHRSLALTKQYQSVVG